MMEASTTDILETAAQYRAGGWRVATDHVSAKERQ